MTEKPFKGKAPAFQFYPSDYLTDPGVRAVCLAARGLWMDMLCIMHESPNRGYLQHPSGAPVSIAQLARMVGTTQREVIRLLSELEQAGVYSRTEAQVIYSRRMVRDNRKAELCRAAGHRGGNPKLIGMDKGEDKPTLKGPLIQEANPEITPSSSVFSLHSSNTPISPSDSSDLNASGMVLDPNRDLCDWYEREFKGEWLPDTWREIPKYLDGETAEAFRHNLPLWMKTRKYVDGFGVNSVKFLSSRIWLKPPPANLMAPQYREPETSNGTIYRSDYIPVSMQPLKPGEEPPTEPLTLEKIRALRGKAV